MYLLLYLAMGIHLYLYSLWCSILVHNLFMHQKQEVNRPLFFFRLWSPGSMRPRRRLGFCLWTRDLHGNKHSAACYTSTVSNTPPYSVYRDECGFFVMGSNPQSKRIQTLGEIKGRIGAALYLVYFDPPSVLVRYPFCIWILIADANLLWKYQILTIRHGRRRSGADAYRVDELTPEKLITEKTDDGLAPRNTGIDSFTNLSFLSMGLYPSRRPPETWRMIHAAYFYFYCLSHRLDTECSHIHLCSLDHCYLDIYLQWDV